MGNRKRKIEVGEVFNSLTFKYEMDLPIGAPRIGVFQCECGSSRECRINSVINGAVKRCKKCLRTL